ncbi:hypothetical protein J1614_006633 [Plenodomus biglobosus]|nr:hypothetical protein J1614_006633 [Plenodomus biglobosus]
MAAAELSQAPGGRLGWLGRWKSSANVQNWTAGFEEKKECSSLARLRKQTGKALPSESRYDVHLLATATAWHAQSSTGALAEPLGSAASRPSFHASLI